MKKLIILSIVITTLSTTVKAQHDHHNTQIVKDTIKTASVSVLLNIYYNIKDALVASKAEVASVKAGEFVKAINGIDMKALSAADHTAFMFVNEKLAFDAEHMAESKDIAHQREHFKTFSDNFFTLAKAVKLSTQPVYQQYCPMKKAAWLSNEAAIKNPYYGNAMLSCGSVKATL
ncbi:MAG: DUF3347 domain-containing protein [Sphingobacteriia bacterium]|nr:MAG: DUF3347 domain-containing protein [Sphingobacteriia bacterium]